MQIKVDFGFLRTVTNLYYIQITLCVLGGLLELSNPECSSKKNYQEISLDTLNSPI